LFHGVEENVFQRIAAVIHAANLHAAVCRDFEDLPDFDAVRHNHLDAAVGENRAFATEALERGGERCLGANGFQLEELPNWRGALDEIANGSNLPVAQDQHLIAGLFDVAEKMRGKQQADTLASRISRINSIKRLRAGRVHAIGGLVEDQDFGAMRNRWASLASLFHAERIRSDRAITRFA